MKMKAEERQKIEAEELKKYHEKAAGYGLLQQWSGREVVRL